ncbi:MAG TPA: hypothetical protein VIO64_14640 [Pseudobacteroides sp.]|uniref:hypothetical protein n=1 Tax=Pseudobacteroides sp. TaxID=1968840 RepID=UPI002F929434
MAKGIGGFGTGETGIAGLIANYIGETVTIFTSSGGQSGAGFTGVVLSVNEVFVRLITRIGPPPACSLGNACNGFNVGGAGYNGHWDNNKGGLGNGYGNGHGAGYGNSFDGWGDGPVLPASEVGAMTAGGWNGYPVATVGSVTDIPIDAIVSFVHNAV